MKNSEILIAARAKLDTPEKWYQGACWADADGDETVSAEHAVCFCTFGAVEAVQPTSLGEDSDAWRYLNEVQHDPISYNDAAFRKHGDILVMFDEAIALAQQEENEDV